MKRRFKIMWISVYSMFEVFAYKNIKAYNPPDCIPKGAKAVTSFFDPVRQCYAIIFYHKSFPELSEAEVIPDFREG